MSDLKGRAKLLSESAQHLRRASGLQIMSNPKFALDLIDDLSALMVDLCAQVDALTPYADEGGAV